MSYYEFEDKKTDRIVICINNIDAKDPDEYWESLVHEATHAMHACTGDYALDDKFMPGVDKELQAINPTSVEDIQVGPRPDAIPLLPRLLEGAHAQPLQRTCPPLATDSITKIRESPKDLLCLRSPAFRARTCESESGVSAIQQHVARTPLF